MLRNFGCSFFTTSLEDFGLNLDHGYEVAQAILRVLINEVKAFEQKPYERKEIKNSHL